VVEEFVLGRLTAWLEAMGPRHRRRRGIVGRGWTGLGGVRQPVDEVQGRRRDEPDAATDVVQSRTAVGAVSD
jgi:hypothetical protein